MSIEEIVERDVRELRDSLRAGGASLLSWATIAEDRRLGLRRYFRTEEQWLWEMTGLAAWGGHATG